MSSPLANRIRKEFPILRPQERPFIYLDFASTGQVPRVVLEAMEEYYRTYKSNIRRGVYAVGEQATAAFEQARTDVAQWIGAKPTETIFTSGTTDSINRIAAMLGDRLKTGDEIWVNVMEHHSNLLPWQRIARQTGAILKWIDITDGQLDIEHLRRSLTSKAKIVAVSQMSNVTGAIAPIREICQRSHEVGARVVVDAAQSIGHLPVNVRNLDCDFLAFSAHKMYGPMGVGVLYGKEALLEGLEPPVQGGGMIQTVERDHALWTELPQKFEAGTPNIAGVIGMGAAVRFLKELSMETIQSEEDRLTQEAIRIFSHIPTLKIFTGSPEPQGPLFSFSHDAVHPHDLATLLDREGIAVRAGHHCAQLFMAYLAVPATTRLSFGMTTTLEEVQQTATVVERAIQLFSK